MRTIHFASYSLLTLVFIFNTSCISLDEPTSVSTLSPSTGGSKPKPKPKPKPKTPPLKRSKKLENVRSTAYCHLENEPGAVGNLNAIGTPLRYGSIRSAAADWSRFPLGTQFRIVGEPHLYEIDDFGSALVGTNTIDFYKPTLGAMHAWGLRYVDIEIVKWGCYHKSIARLPANSKYWHVRKMHNDIALKLR